MSVSANFFKLSKKKNSTKQPTGTGTAFSVDLKSGTSLLSPTLLLNNSGKPDFNYFSFEGMYYFITDIVSVRNDLWEIYSKVDPLATAKTAITASTQFVSYSSSVTADLADTRLAVTKSVGDSVQQINVPLFKASGSYVLTVVGRTGCRSYVVSAATLTLLIHDLQTWVDDEGQAIRNVLDDTQTVEKILVQFAEVNQKAGILDNSYKLAVEAIRNCVWVPFDPAVIGGTSATIYLGNYKCTTNSGQSDLTGDLLVASIMTDNLTISIPWHYSDWRRAYCEDVYLYLPFVGMVQLSSDSLRDTSSLHIKMSATPVDGQVAYEVWANNQILGTYGGSCCAQQPIGINQFNSFGQTANAVFGGASKTIAAAVAGFKLGGEAGFIAGAAVGTTAMATNVTSSAYATNMSCIGGVGGGAGGGLDLYIQCYTVYHDTVVSPSNADYIATMGGPTMKAMSLSGLSGYCQCANAHVAADLPGPILEAIDQYLNSGFFIE